MARSTAQARKKKVVKTDAEKAAGEEAEHTEAADAVVEDTEQSPADEETGEASGEGTDAKMDLEQGDGDTNDNDEDEEAENAMLADDDEDKIKKEGEAMEVGDTEDGDKDDQDDEDDDDDDDDDEESESNDKNQTKRKKGQAAAKKTKKPKIEKPVKVNIYVPSILEEELEAPMQTLFASSDIEVKELKKAEDRTWVLFGEVELVKAADKEKVLALTGREVVVGRGIKVELVPEEDPDTKINAPDECILFVRNIDKLTTDESLKELFPDAKSIKLPEKDDKNRGFAFLEFESKEKVEELIKEKQKVELDGKELELSHFTSNKGKTKRTGQAGKTKVLFIGNLNYDTKESTIKSKFPTSTAVRILRFANTGKSKGVGFIEFKTPKDAEEAFDNNKTTSIDDREVLLDFAGEKRNTDESSFQERRSGGRGGFRGGSRGGSRGGYVSRDAGRGGGYRSGGGGYGGGGRYGSDRMRTMLELEADYAYADRMAIERRIAMGRMGLERELGAYGGLGGMGMDTGYGDYMGYAMGGQGGYGGYEGGGQGRNQGNRNQYGGRNKARW